MKFKRWYDVDATMSRAIAVWEKADENIQTICADYVIDKLCLIQCTQQRYLVYEADESVLHGVLGGVFLVRYLESLMVHQALVPYKQLVHKLAVRFILDRHYAGWYHGFSFPVRQDMQNMQKFR